MRRSIVCLLLVGMLVSAGGCLPFFNWINQQAAKKTGASDLYRFKSAQELKDFLVQQYQTRNSSQYTDMGGWFFPVAFLATPMASTATVGTQRNDAAAPESGDKSEQYSTTNTQEQGVDESDVMKNDANYVYILKNKCLLIASVRPPETLEQIGKLELAGAPKDMYLLGDTVIALAQSTPYYYYWDYAVKSAVDDVYSPNDIQEPVEAIVTIIDVSNRSAPAILRSYRLEGTLVESRMIDGKLHLVMTATPNLPPVVADPNTPVDEILPVCRVLNAMGGTVASSPVAGWQDFYRPSDPDGYGLVTVTTLDTTDPNATVTSVGLTADAGVIYASTTALYITDTDWGYSSNSEQQTIVHKFRFSDDGPQYVSSGSVPGRPLNQFSLGEYEGYLRIATTLGFVSRSGSGSTNNVFVLGEGTSKLEKVGQIRDIAPGEQIYSARFLGPRGFLVTFQKVDPLFTLDLADPCNPKVAGELKVPGYSDYIHPLDANHLLTIGKDAEEVEGENFAWYQGVQLSIFDVSDFSKPTLLHKVIIGSRGTESQALHDHKAFNYFAPKNMLAIPISVVEGGQGGPTYGQHTFTGLYVYRVTPEEGFELKGRISTAISNPTSGWYDRWYSYSWTRSAIIGDSVYAITDEMVRSAALSDVGTVLDTLMFTTEE